jgi:hypothetical protein
MKPKITTQPIEKVMGYSTDRAWEQSAPQTTKFEVL